MNVFSINHLCTAIIVLISSTALLGWWTDHATLADWLPAIADMTFNTALSFLLIALACFTNGMRFLPAKGIQTGIVVAVGLLALLSLLQDLFGLDLRIDNLLFDSHNSRLSSPHPGRMSPVTAVGFLLSTVVLISLQYHQVRNVILTHMLAALLGMLAVVGIGMNIFMYDVPSSYSHLASISLLTAVCFLLLAIILLRTFAAQQKLDTDILLHSGIQLMYRLKYPQKFALISLIFIIPLTLLIWDELHIHDQRIADAKLKIVGLAHIKETEKLAKAIPEHRGMTNAWLADPQLFAKALQTKTTEVDRLFAENARMDRQHADVIDVPDTWAKIDELWQQIKHNPDNALLSWHWHTEIIALLNSHLRDVGRQTRLSYDANPAIHNQLALQLEIMPELLEQIGQLRGQGAGFLAQKAINKQQQINLTSKISKIKLLLSEAALLFHSNRSVSQPEALRKAFEHFNKNCNVFIDKARQQLIQVTTPTADAEDFFALGTHAISPGLALSQYNMEQIEHQLEQRINASITAQYNIKLMAMITALLLLFLFAAFYRSVINTITALNRVTERMSRGDENQALEAIPGSDEMADIVTSFHRIADQLVQTGKYMSAVVDYAAEGIITIDSNGIIQTFNPAAEQMFGYQSDTIIGKNILQLIPELSRRKHQDGLKHLVQTGESEAIRSARPLQVSGLRKDGSLFPMELSISVIELDKQQMFVGIVRDTSQRESLENQLRHAQKMEAIGALVGGVAHNFNNLLAGIIGKAYMARRKAKDLPEILSYLESIETISNQAGDMIKQLLTFARKDFFSNQQDLPLDTLIKESFKTASLSIPEDIRLDLHIMDTGIMVHCDANQLQQVLMNMMNNARDALQGCNNKQITVCVERCRPDKAFFARHTDLTVGEYACLSISDTGQGMDAETAAKIFDPFYTTKEVGKGTGLGLSTAFGIISSHHGIIEVDSKPEHGTTFRIYLPLTASASSDVRESDDQSVVPGCKHETLLLVDDEPLVLHANKEVLEELGYNIIGARNGRQGLEQFKKHQHEIDAVITDIVMPEMSGLEMLRKIRALRSDIPAILITGYDQKQIGLDSDEQRISVVLVKPVQIPTLSQHIRKLLKA